MGTPNSGDCRTPRVSVISSQPRTDQDIGAVSDRYPAPKAKTPEELETSFVQIFKDYTEAAARNKEAPEFADCEQKLIKVIRQFRNVKTVYHKFFPQFVNLKEVFPLMIELLKDDKYGKRLASCTHEDYAVPGQKCHVALLVQSLLKMGALEVFASTLGKFSERDDLRAVQNIAQILFQSAAAVATIAGGNSKLMNWVLEATF